MVYIVFVTHQTQWSEGWHIKFFQLIYYIGDVFFSFFFLFFFKERHIRDRDHPSVRLFSRISFLYTVMVYVLLAHHVFSCEPRPSPTTRRLAPNKKVLKNQNYGVKIGTCSVCHVSLYGLKRVLYFPFRCFFPLFFEIFAVPVIYSVTTVLCFSLGPLSSPLSFNRFFAGFCTGVTGTFP